MKPSYVTQEFLDQFISAALAEDIGDGDHTTLGAIGENEQHSARLIVKDEGILAGVELAWQIFHHVDKSLRIEIALADGSQIAPGDVAFTVAGSARSILTTERLVLNCMQRMSGIATRTRHLVNLVKGTGVQLLDTRKTTPNFRLPEKWAVVIGGGHNHRLGLYDMVMLKDNHVDMAGGIGEAIKRINDYLRATKRRLKIEIETRTLTEVEEVLKIGQVDVIMLDNMDLDTLRRAVVMIGGKFQTEASGGVTEETIRAIADCGVDFISVGALTHSVRSLDLSLKTFT